MNKWHIICAVMTITIGVQFAMFLNLNNKYASLSSDYSSLNSQYSILESNYTSARAENMELKAQYAALSFQFITLTTNFTTLQNRYSELASNYSELLLNYTTLQNHYDEVMVNYTSLQKTHQTLQANYASLEAQYEMLQSNYTSLQIDYETLQTSYETLETQCSSLQSSYDSLKAEYDGYKMAYERLRDEVNHRWDLQNLETFITPEDPSVSSIVVDITGGWSNHSDWGEFWNELKVMYDWVIDNIKYRYDGLFPNLPDEPSSTVDYWNEMWQFPNETLNLEKGDCEDMAILLCSMIRSYNDMEYETECIGITSSTIGHLAVQCPLDDKLVIFDPAGQYYSSDFWGDIVFNEISTEIDNWLDYWKPEMGNDVYVDLVFSDYFYKTFISTGEYLDWMYNR